MCIQIRVVILLQMERVILIPVIRDVLWRIFRPEVDCLREKRSEMPEVEMPGRAMDLRSMSGM